MGKSTTPEGYSMLRSKLLIVNIFVFLYVSSPGQVMGDSLAIILHGSEMNREDYSKMQHSCEFRKSGDTTSWVNGESGQHYSVTPQPAYSHRQTNLPCRKAEIRASLNGLTEQVITVSCRDKNGNWIIKEISPPRIINQPQPISPPQPILIQSASEKAQAQPSPPTSTVTMPTSQSPPRHRWKKPVQ